MDTNKEMLKTNAEKYAKARDVDPSKIDFESVLDKELSDGENWDIIKEKVEQLMDTEDKLEEKAENLTEEEIKAKEREIHERYIEEIQQEKEEELEEQFEDDQHEEVQSFYNMFNYYLKSIARGHHHAFMVNAEPGIGKSYQTNQTLIEEVGHEKFEKSPAVSSPFEFYKQLWELEQDQEKEILVLDDIEGLLKNKKALAILKQATWSETDDRYVGWNSSPSKLKTKDGQDIPAEFKFTGKLVMIFNEVPDDIIFESLKDRCFYYELSFSYEQKCKLIKALADKGLGYDVDEQQRKQMARWMIDVTTPATAGLNIRTFEKALIHYGGCMDINPPEGVTWKKIVKESLDIDEDLEATRDIVKDTSFDSVGDRKSEFKDRTGKSGRTFVRCRDKLVDNSEEIREIVEGR